MVSSQLCGKCFVFCFVVVVVVVCFVVVVFCFVCCSFVFFPQVKKLGEVVTMVTKMFLPYII